MCVGTIKPRGIRGSDKKKAKKTEQELKKTKDALFNETSRKETTEKTLDQYKEDYDKLKADFRQVAETMKEEAAKKASEEENRKLKAEIDDWSKKKSAAEQQKKTLQDQLASVQDEVGDAEEATAETALQRANLEIDDFK